MNSPKTIIFLLIASAWSLVADYLTPVSVQKNQTKSGIVHFENNDESLPVGIRSNSFVGDFNRSETDADDIAGTTHELQSQTLVQHSSGSLLQLTSLRRIAHQLTLKTNLEVILHKLLI